MFHCDCGNEVECYLSNVTTGKTNSCGKNCGLMPHTYDNVNKKGLRADLTGQRFGRLLVVEKMDDKNGWTQFRCKCDCGSEIVTSGSNLKYGATRSCGCLHRETMKNIYFEDLIGQRFGKLIVTDKSTTKWNKLHWVCQCDCGNETIVSTGGLKSGHTQSCGCFQDEIASDRHFIDLSGKKFGKLTVIKRIKNSKTGLVRYECQCECGNKSKVVGATLIDGRTQSCGCWKYSKLEENVLRYFREKNYINTIDYEWQKKFEDLVGIGGKLLSYDFIFYKNNEPYYLIECQGKQHYQPVEHFGGKERFEIQQKHDKLKKEYAIKLEIPLLEIPYTVDTYKEISNILKDIGI